MFTINRYRLLIIFSLILTFLISCTTYQAPALPEHELATIGIDPTSYRIRFLGVDDTYLSYLGGLNSFSGRKDLKIKPGKRIIHIAYSDAVGNGNLREGGSKLVFEARANERYIVHEKTEGQRFKTWITREDGSPVELLQE